MNFLMWFGNTTIMLIAAINGISMEIFEACDPVSYTHLDVYKRQFIDMVQKYCEQHLKDINNDKF